MATLPPRWYVAYKCKSLSVCGQSETGAWAALPLYCRKWDCPDCGKFQRRRLRRRLIAGTPDTFATLTTNPNLFTTPEAAFKQASLAINRLFKVLRRHYPRRRIEYALVWETTKKGWPHAHILLRAPFIPQAFLSRTWERLSGARIVDIRRLRNEGEAAAYVTKYVTKDPSVPPGYRRYRTSQGFSSPPPKGQLGALLSIDTWLRSSAPLPQLIADFTSRGIAMHEYMPDLYVSSATRSPPPP